MEKKSDQVKYAEIILDFSYFKISAAQDKKIEDDAVITAFGLPFFFFAFNLDYKIYCIIVFQNLLDLDEQIRENYLEILTRVYLAFESIHQYVIDLKAFIQELHDGMYIQQTVESVLQDEEGKQLMVSQLGPN